MQVLVQQNSTLFLRHLEEERCSIVRLGPLSLHPPHTSAHHAEQSSYQAVVVWAAHNQLFVILTFRFIGLQTGLHAPFHFSVHYARRPLFNSLDQLSLLLASLEQSQGGRVEVTG